MLRHHTAYAGPDQVPASSDQPSQGATMEPGSIGLGETAM